MADNPLLRALTLTDANTNYTLSTLIQALTGLTDYPARCAHLRIQFDPDGAAAELKVGNVGELSDTDFGVQLSATQVYEVGPLESNLIILSQIAVRSDIAAKKIHISVVQR